MIGDGVRFVCLRCAGNVGQQIVRNSGWMRVLIPLGLIKSKGVYSVDQKMRQLAFKVRSVFDYPKMSENACASALP